MGNIEIGKNMPVSIISNIPKKLGPLLGNGRRVILKSGVLMKNVEKSATQKSIDSTFNEEQRSHMKNIVLLISQTTATRSSILKRGNMKRCCKIKMGNVPFVNCQNPIHVKNDLFHLRSIMMLRPDKYAVFFVVHVT